MTRILRSIGVMCGSNSGVNPAFTTAAREMGRALAIAHIRAVFGGVRTGLMSSLADSILEHGGSVIGVVPQFLMDEGLSYKELCKLQIVPTMNERKATMVELSDATIMLPGGVGTQDEFWEYLAGAQLGFHAKPCGILNVDGYYDPLLAFIDRALAEGFLSAVDKRNMVVGQSAEALIAELSQRVSGGIGKGGSHG